jgi:hypothetical protein
MVPGRGAPRGPRGTRARRALHDEDPSVFAARGRPWRDDTAHWYFVSFGFVAFLAIAVAILLVPIVVLLHPLWPMLIFGPVMIPCVVLARGAELTVAPQGLRFLGARYDWDELELAVSDLGDVLQTKPGSRPRRTRIYLRMYANDWRSSPIGHDLRTWAPHLFAEDAAG